MNHPTYSDVIEQERQWTPSLIVSLWKKGKTPQEIAAYLACSDTTVYKVLRNYRKMKGLDSTGILV